MDGGDCCVPPLLRDSATFEGDVKRVARDGASELAASFSRRVGMPSQPGLFDGSRLDSNFETSWAVVSSVVRPGVLGVGE